MSVPALPNPHGPGQENRRSQPTPRLIQAVRIITTRECYARCGFCDFSRYRPMPEAPDARRHLGLGPLLALPSADLYRIGGGLNAMRDWDACLALIRQVSRQSAARVQGLSAPELDQASALLGRSVGDLIGMCQEAGLHMLGSGGAEVLDDSVRRAFAPGRITSERWLDIHRLAHARGLPSVAGILIGEFLSPTVLLRHLDALASLDNGFDHLEIKVLRPADTRLARLAPPSLLQVLDVIAAVKARFPQLPVHMRAEPWSGDAVALLAAAGVDALIRTIEVIEP